MAFVRVQYAAGRSLRAIADLTHRSFPAVRNIVDENGTVHRRVGAVVVTIDDTPVRLTTALCGTGTEAL